MNHNRYVEAGRKVLQEAEEKNKIYQGNCSECVYWRRHFFGLHRCVNPLVKLAVFNQEDEYNRDILHRCSDQRLTSSPFGQVVCEPQGTLFEPRTSLTQWIVAQLGIE